MLLALPVFSRTQPEIPAVMLQAAEARLQESEALFVAQHWDGAVYLAGYVAEMLLKVAFCNLDPTFPGTATVDTIFGPARSVWNRTVPGTKLPDQHKHSILFWETVLEPHRRASGANRMEWGDALLLSKHLSTIQRYWRVDLRYQSSLLTQDEAHAVCAAARWLFNNRKVFGVIS